MRRVTTKKDLIESANTQYQKLIDLLNSISIEAVNKPFAFNVDERKEAHWKRDVFVHLYE